MKHVAGGTKYTQRISLGNYHPRQHHAKKGKSHHGKTAHLIVWNGDTPEKVSVNI